MVPREQEKGVMAAELLGVRGLWRSGQFPLIPKDFCVTLSPDTFPCLQCGDKVYALPEKGKACFVLHKPAFQSGLLLYVFPTPHGPYFT